MKIKIISTLCTLSLAGNTFAMTTYPYEVKVGDSLSEIIYKMFPDQRIYGRSGLLLKTILLNPDMKDPNRILIGQVIYLPQPIQRENLVEQIPEVEKEVVFKIEEKKDFVIDHPKEVERKIAQYEEAQKKIEEEKEIVFRDEFHLSLMYGAHFNSISQSGVLGAGNLGSLFFNQISLMSEMAYNHWALETQLHSYEFNYSSETSNDTAKMYGLNINGYYKWFSLGLELSQQPIFKNDSGNLILNTLSVGSAGIGFKKNFELNTKKKTLIQLSSNAYLPVMVSSGKPDIDFTNISGYGINLNLNYKKQLIFNPNYELYLNWMNQLSHRKYKFDADWATSVGEVDASYTDMIFLLGVSLSF